MYDESVQETVIDQITTIISKLVTELHGEEFEPDTHPLVPLSAYINMYLHHIEPIFKNPAFREEAEWRVIYFPKSHVENTWDVDPSKWSLSDLDETAALKFRFREDDIIPHFSFPKEHDLQSIVNNLMLGPLCKMNLIPLSLFLKSYKFSSFAIERSKASLR